jgi:hypothetical protein
MRVANLLLLAMLSIVVACSSSSDDVTPMLSISVDGIDLSGSALNFESAESVKVDVNSNSLWRVRCNAAWVKLGPVEGNGKGSFMVSVDDAVVSRSAVVVVSLVGNEHIRHTFDVIQRVAPLEPDNNPNHPTPPAEDNPEQNPDTPSDGDDNTDGDKPNEGSDDDGGNTTPPDDITPPDDNGDTPSGNDEQGDFSLIDELHELNEGCYHIGGYQDGVLHLATGGLTSVNHCNTAIFEFGEDGSLVSDATAAEIVLEAADAENGYYIRFAEDGYLTAKASGAGKLQFSAEKSEYWIFSAHEEGGFVLRQSGDIDVKLIISQNAQSDVLRSIAGDEDANAVIFLKINHPE